MALGQDLLSSAVHAIWSWTSCRNPWPVVGHEFCSLHQLSALGRPHPWNWLSWAPRLGGGGVCSSSCCPQEKRGPHCHPSEADWMVYAARILIWYALYYREKPKLTSEFPYDSLAPSEEEVTSRNFCYIHTHNMHIVGPGGVSYGWVLLWEDLSGRSTLCLLQQIPRDLGSKSWGTLVHHPCIIYNSGHIDLITSGHDSKESASLLGGLR